MQLFEELLDNRHFCLSHDQKLIFFSFTSLVCIGLIIKRANTNSDVLFGMFFVVYLILLRSVLNWLVCLLHTSENILQKQIEYWSIMRKYSRIVFFPTFCFVFWESLRITEQTRLIKKWLLLFMSHLKLISIKGLSKHARNKVWPCLPPLWPPN